jgi:malate synthase
MILQWEFEELERIEKYVGEERLKREIQSGKRTFNELIFSEKF